MNRMIVFSVAAVLAFGVMTSAVSAAPAKLAGDLLSIGQMPTGWSVDNSTGGNGVGCLSSILEPKGIKQVSHASITFDDGGNPPLVDEKLGTYSNSKAAYKKIISTLESCKHVNVTTGGVKTTAVIGQMSFPTYGDASGAFSVSISSQGATLADDVLIVRSGDVIMGIEEGDFPPVNTTQFERFVVEALAKIK